MKRCVGIDVAKTELKVFIQPTGEHLLMVNNKFSVRQLRGLGQKDFVILEATGGLEAPIVGTLRAAVLRLRWSTRWSKC